MFGNIFFLTFFRSNSFFFNKFNWREQNELCTSWKKYEPLNDNQDWVIFPDLNAFYNDDWQFFTMKLKQNVGKIQM